MELHQTSVRKKNVIQLSKMAASMTMFSYSRGLQLLGPEMYFEAKHMKHKEKVLVVW